MKCKKLPHNKRKSPKARNTCSLEHYGGNLYLFGGHNGNKPEFFKDFWIYKMDDYKWERIESKGDIPPDIGYHRSVIYRNWLIIFGGVTYSTTGAFVCFNDIYGYNFNSNVWKIFDAKNSPSKRYWHSMTIHNNLLIVCGGTTPKSKILKDTYMINIKDLIIDTKESISWIKIDLGLSNQGLYGNILISNSVKL